MDKNGKVTNGPYWTQNWIEAMWRFTAERFVNFDTGAVDFEALGREEYEFRKALFFRNFKNSPRAKKVFDEADEEYKKKVENGKQGGRPRKEEPGAVAIDSSKGKKSAQAGSHKAGNAIAPIPAAQAEEPVVMNLAYSGEFGNVRLTQQEYSELGIRFGNKRALDRAIDSLSCQIENGEKDPKSHYAELVKWATYRDDMDEKKELEDSKPKMTNMEKSWISAMKKVGIMQ